MFTGLVAGPRHGRGRGRDGRRRDAGRPHAPGAGEIAEGDSVAVNGVCLTATAIADGAFRADVMHETLRRSSLGRGGGGRRVNLELAAARRRPARRPHRAGPRRRPRRDRAPSQRGRLRPRRRRSPRRRPAPLRRREGLDRRQRRLAHRRRRSTGDAFSVSLIPETLERTTLGAAAPGAPVNLEVDVVAKYVEKLVAR